MSQLQYNAQGQPIVVINPNMQTSGANMQGGTAAQYANSPYARFPAQQPALTNPTQPSNSGILSNPMSNNSRSYTQLSVKRPDLSIGTNEMLMRVGGAGLEGAQKSGLQSYANMLNTYGGIQDQRRANAMTEYNADYRAESDQRAIEAELEKAKSKGKSQQGMPSQSPYTQATLDAIAQIESAVNSEEAGSWLNPFDDVTGLTGAGMALIPGTPAYDTNAQIETVISSIGFDRLQKMRDESPTGGALGQVSERELSQLNASLGNLRQSQSRESFKRNLQQVKRHYLAAVEAIRRQQIEYARMNGLPVPASASSVPTTVGQSSQIGGVTVTRIK